MRICPVCGVELDDRTTKCPLCGENPNFQQKADEGNPYLSEELKPLDTKQRLRLGWEITSLLLLSSSLVAFLIDLFTTKSFSWSRYPLLGLFCAWNYVTVLLFVIRRFALAVPLLSINSLVLLFFLDLFNGSLTWFLPLGVPIVAVFTVVGIVVYWIAKASKSRGFNVFAFVILGIAVFTMGIELAIDRFLMLPLELSWSGLVLASILPFTILLLFFHYRMRKKIDLKRVFRL